MLRLDEGETRRLIRRVYRFSRHSLDVILIVHVCAWGYGKGSRLQTSVCDPPPNEAYVNKINNNEKPFASFVKNLII